MPLSAAFDRVVLVHGFGAGTTDHWFPWLADQLPALQRLALPASDTPDAAVWIPLVREALAGADERTAVVTHSLGGITAARAMADLGHDGVRFGALVAVAPFAEPLPTSGQPDLDHFRTSGLPLFLKGFEPDVLRSTVARRVVIHSTDDPFVPASASDAFAAQLDADLVVVPDAGHFLATDGVTRLPQVLAALARGHA